MHDVDPRTTAQKIKSPFKVQGFTKMTSEASCEAFAVFRLRNVTLHHWSFA